MFQRNVVSLQLEDVVEDCNEEEGDKTTKIIMPPVHFSNFTINPKKQIHLDQLTMNATSWVWYKELRTKRPYLKNCDQRKEGDAVTRKGSTGVRTSCVPKAQF